jgi:hypothetical protein
MRWGRWWVVLGLLGSGAAFAETKVRVVREADRTVVRKRTSVDFTRTDVEGDLTKPDGDYVLERSRAELPNLLHIRDNFAPELRRSVDNL